MNAIGHIIRLYEEWITLASGQIPIKWINCIPIVSAGQRFIRWIKLPTLRTNGPRALKSSMRIVVQLQGRMHGDEITHQIN